jgi:hypothetical protein
LTFVNYNHLFVEGSNSIPEDLCTRTHLPTPFQKIFAHVRTKKSSSQQFFSSLVVDKHIATMSSSSEEDGNADDDNSEDEILQQEEEEGVSACESEQKYIESGNEKKVLYLLCIGLNRPDTNHEQPIFSFEDEPWSLLPKTTVVHPKKMDFACA